jgi:hypothetical protein
VARRLRRRDSAAAAPGSARSVSRPRAARRARRGDRGSRARRSRRSARRR